MVVVAAAVISVVALGAVVVLGSDRWVERVETRDFAFSYPEGWRVMANPGVRLQATAPTPISQSTVGVSDELVVGVIGPNVLPEAITAANVEQLLPGSELDWAGAMARPGARSELDPVVTTHGGLPALESRAIYTQPFGPTEVRLVTVYAGRRMYGISCYTRLSEPRVAREAFARGCDQVLATFEARRPQ